MSYGKDGALEREPLVRRNRSQFIQKWSAMLPEQGASKTPPRHFADRRPIGRALVIDSSTPTPDRDSGSLDLINLMRILIELGYRITFVPDDNFARLGAYTEKLEDMGIECICAPYETSVRGLVTSRGDVFDLVILSRCHVAASHFKTVRESCPSARVVFNIVDLHFLREERKAALEGCAGQEISEAKRTELDLANDADAAITVSSFEAQLLTRERPTAPIFTIPVIREIPGRAGEAHGRRDILFIGGFDHPPNADAVVWFVREILPIIQREVGDIIFHIVGSNIPDIVARLGVAPDRHGPVLVHGHVKDLAPIFARIRLTVAPLRYGAGIKGKVATSLAYGVPCVATTIGVEGSNLVPDEEILVADDPEQFAQAAVRLCRDDALWRALSHAGLAAANRQFSLAANRPRVAELLTEIEAPPFFGNCPVCMQHARFDARSNGQIWKRPVCSGCGADTVQRAMAIAVKSCLRSMHAVGRNGRVRQPMLLMDVTGPLGGMLAGLGETIIRGATLGNGAGQPVDGVVLGRIVPGETLAQLRARLGPIGWMVIGDPCPEDVSPIDFAIERRELFLAAGLVAHRGPSPAGTGLVEAAAWIARPSDQTRERSLPALFPRHRGLQRRGVGGENRIVQ
jgi:glycosyltransferase involved in cell wall biosynthesis